MPRSDDRPFVASQLQLQTRHVQDFVNDPFQPPFDPYRDYPTQVPLAALANKEVPMPQDQQGAAPATAWTQPNQALYVMADGLTYTGHHHHQGQAPAPTQGTPPTPPMYQEGTVAEGFSNIWVAQA
eukprot:669995-Rhodomonas_salina.2